MKHRTTLFVTKDIWTEYTELLKEHGMIPSWRIEHLIKEDLRYMTRKHKTQGEEQ